MITTDIILIGQTTHTKRYRATYKQMILRNSVSCVWLAEDTTLLAYL